MTTPERTAFSNGMNGQPTQTTSEASRTQHGAAATSNAPIKASPRPGEVIAQQQGPGTTHSLNGTSPHLSINAGATRSPALAASTSPPTLSTQSIPAVRHPSASAQPTPPARSASHSSPVHPEAGASASNTPRQDHAHGEAQGQQDELVEDDAAAALLAAHKANIKRGRGSCVYCRRRKQRCDPGPTLDAPCEPCKRLGKVCEYPPNGIHAPRPPPATVLYPVAAASMRSDGGEEGEQRRPGAKGIKLTFGGGARTSSPPGYGQAVPQRQAGYPDGQAFPSMGVGLGIGSAAGERGSPQLPSTSLGRQSGGQEKRSRRDVDFSSDDEGATPGAGAGGLTQAAAKKRRPTVDFSSDGEDRPENIRRESQGESGELSALSGGGGGAQRAPEDDELMEAVEGNAAASGSNAGVAGDDEIDELMEEVGGDVTIKSERSKGMAAAGEGLEEEVEGELLMLADPAPKPRKASPRRTSGGPSHASAAQAHPKHGANGHASSSHSRSHRSQHPVPVGMSPAQPGPYAAAPTVWGPPVQPMFGAGPGFNGMPPPEAQFAGPQEVLSPYGASLQALLPALPPHPTQQILFQAFFSDYLLAEGLALLQPQYTEDCRNLLQRRSQHPPQPFIAGDATTLAVGFAVMAASLRVMPEETSQILLSSVIQTSNPRSFSRILTGQGASQNDATALHRRYVDHALVASQLADMEDPPSVMQVLLKLVLYRYGRLCANSPTTDLLTSLPAAPRYRDRMVVIGGWLAQGIKVAQAMGMHREWDGIPLIERELRRRLYWSLYDEDRFHAFATSFPYTINDTHNTVEMPSPLSEPDLYALPATTAVLPVHSTEETPTFGTHLYIVAHLARLITKLIDTQVLTPLVGPDDELLAKYDASLEQFEEALPPYSDFVPYQVTAMDAKHPYLPAHRTHVLSCINGTRIAVHRPRIPTYLVPTCAKPRRKTLSETYEQALRVQRSARMLEYKYAFRLFEVEKVFEAGVVLGMIYRVDRTLSKVAAGEAAQSHHTDEELGECRSGLKSAIELLEGVSGWPDAAFQAQKALLVLQRMLARLDQTRPPPTDAKAAIDDITAWLGAWKGSNIEMLMAEAEWRDWQRIVEAM